MMNIYWSIVIAVVLLGQIMPQNGKNKKKYIVTMSILHIFVCGLRYKFLTGDLIKYEWNYRDLLHYGWLDKAILERKNLGFVYFMKCCAEISNGEFQFCLFLIALISEITLAVLIYRYSPKPWLSYLVWNCMSLYIFGFSAIKQALAMSFIVLAMMYIMEYNARRFLLCVLIAGAIHAPAFVFLPAYWIAHRRINASTVLMYIVVGIVVFALRNPIVEFISGLYYEEDTIEIVTTTLGGRFFVIILILLAGMLLKGFRQKRFEMLFNIIIVAAILQMFSGFNNVFTRLADYYFQFSVLLIPMIFSDEDEKEKQNINERARYPMLYFNQKSLRILTLILTLILMWFYWETCLGVTIDYETDNYLNYRTMWDVSN